MERLYCSFKITYLVSDRTRMVVSLMSHTHKVFPEDTVIQDQTSSYVFQSPVSDADTKNKHCRIMSACRLVRPLWKTVWNFLRKLKMELPFDLAIPLLGLYPKNPETPIQKNVCKRTYAPQCSQQHNLQQPSTGSNLSVHQQMSGSKNYGIFTQWNSTQQRERRSSYTLQQHG